MIIYFCIISSNVSRHAYKMADRQIYIHNGDFVLRRATPSDYQAVIDIDDNVFDGLDYMPLMFYQFLQSRHHVVLVIEHAGQIVSIIISVLIITYSLKRHLNGVL